MAAAADCAKRAVQAAARRPAAPRNLVLLQPQVSGLACGTTPTPPEPARVRRASTDRPSPPPRRRAGAPTALATPGRPPGGAAPRRPRLAARHPGPAHLRVLPRRPGPRRRRTASLPSSRKPELVEQTRQRRPLEPGPPRGRDGAPAVPPGYRKGDARARGQPAVVDTGWPAACCRSAMTTRGAGSSPGKPAGGR